jgi:hypothetical protein
VALQGFEAWAVDPPSAFREVEHHLKSDIRACRSWVQPRLNIQPDRR